MILVLGQNAAWQKTYLADPIDLGSVNRMREAYGSAAGKGANVARVVVGLGGSALLLSYAGGATGRRYTEACRSDGIDIRSVEIPGDTRTCTTLIEPSGRTTEIIEPAPRVTQGESEAYLEAFEQTIDDAAFLVISGTAVSGEPIERYRQYVETAHRAGVEVLLDSYRDHGREALFASPEVLKINADELSELTEMPTGTPEERLAACATLVDAYRIRWIIITLGKEGAEAYSEEAVVSATPPAVEAVNNIGSGDAFTAGVAAAVVEAGSVEAAEIAEAVRRAVALGTANCRDLKPGRVDGDVYNDVLNRVELRSEDRTSRRAE